MLQFFRINDPYRLIFILLILVGVRFFQSHFIEGQSLLDLKWLVLGQWLGEGFYMYSETYDYTGPLTAFVYKILDLLFDRSIMAHRVFSSILIILQAAIFNKILLKNKVFNESNYLPAFLYVIMATCVPDFMSLSPQLMSMLFVLITLGNVLRRINNQATDELFLSSGIYVGIASMFYLPSVVFLIVFLFSLILFSSPAPHRLLLYLFGFALVVTLHIVYFYWRGDVSYFIHFYLFRNLSMSAEWLISKNELVLILLPFAFLLTLSISRTISSARLTNFQKRTQQVIWFMFFGGVVSFLLSNRKSGAELTYIVPLLAYFLNHYFMLLKNQILKLIMPVFIIFGSIMYSTHLYQNVFFIQEKIKPISDEKILSLGGDLTFYSDKKACSPCFSKSLCKLAFEGLDFYQSSITIYDWLAPLEAILIVDHMDVVPKLFHRFPLIEERYRVNSQGDYERITDSSFLPSADAYPLQMLFSEKQKPAFQHTHK